MQGPLTGTKQKTEQLLNQLNHEQLARSTDFRLQKGVGVSAITLHPGFGFVRGELEGCAATFTGPFKR